MITKRTLLFFVVFIVGISVFMGASVLAQQEIRADGNPNLEVYVPDNTVVPGEKTELTLSVDNDGELTRGQESDRELVTTARSVVIDVDADETPITVTSNQRSLGTLREDDPPRDTSFGIEVPDSAEPGIYEIDVEIEYRYTSRVRQTEGITDQNERTRSTTKTVDIEISDDARFRIEDVNSTLRVGEDGEITGNVTNIGHQDATNAEVRFSPDSSNLVALETAVAVGDIPAGESASFRLPVEANSEAEPVRKRFDLPVSYRDQNGIRVEDDDPDFIAAIAPQRDEFIVEPVDQNITAGTNTELELNITNNRDQTLTDIEAKLFTDSPLDSNDNEAFIGSLAPGESTTITLDLSASAGATAKTYPVTVDFRYDDARGRSQLSDSYRLPIDVQPGESGGILPWLVGIGLTALAALIGLPKIIAAKQNRSGSGWRQPVDRTSNRSE